MPFHLHRGITAADPPNHFSVLVGGDSLVGMFQRLFAPARLSATAIIGTMAVACGDSDSALGVQPPTVQPNLYDMCVRDADCIDGWCLQMTGSNGEHDSWCTRACEDGCPPPGQCGVAPDGSQVCYRLRCADEGLYACVGGTPTACDQLGESECGTCGCPDGFRCDVEAARCVPKGEVGDPCESAEFCKSGNCSPILNICRVPNGERCTEENCDYCITHPNGWSYCGAPCYYADDCGSDYCSTISWHCTPGCSGPSDSSCLGVCVENVYSSRYYCYCSECEYHVLKPTQLH